MKKIKKCSCIKTYLSSKDYSDVSVVLMKPNELGWRCCRCEKFTKLNFKELEIANNMFKSGYYFGKKLVREKLRKLLEEL